MYNVQFENVLIKLVEGSAHRPSKIARLVVG